jgi:D-tagatose-1,6-bisphosphate aldolase subunit GatZ/KbaZ
MKAESALAGVVSAQKSGRPRGLYSICSAHPLVLRASMLQALEDGVTVCIEATSNQVNQEGGYTGKRPADFHAYVQKVAAEVAFPAERVLLGGDHLGPHVWQHLDANQAMEKAAVLVREYVLAGFTKIHLDASMPLGGDGAGPVDDETVASRTARLCKECEEAFALRREQVPDSPGPRYVIGTEVPVPGGAHGEEETLAVTAVADAAQAISVTRQAFLALGLEGAWARVVASVVQPGVEFSDSTVHDYDRARAAPLSEFIKGQEALVFECHSTDYQTRAALRQLVEDQFAILKVGPGLTFAFREALFSLAAMEEELLRGKGASRSDLEAVLDRVMTTNPVHWRKHYQGSEADIERARKYSFSDRSRYYWPDRDLEAAVSRLIGNLEQEPVPLNLLSQHMPLQYRRAREGAIGRSPTELILDKIREVILDYAHAVGDRVSPVG